MVSGIETQLPLCRSLGIDLCPCQLLEGAMMLWQVLVGHGHMQLPPVRVHHHACRRGEGLQAQASPVTSLGGGAGDPPCRRASLVNFLMTSRNQEAASSSRNSPM